MNLLATFTFFVVVTVINGTPTSEFKDVCLEELGIKPDDFSLTDTKREHWCVFKCIGQKAGFLDANGKRVDVHTVFGKPMTPEMEEQLKDCYAITSDNICEEVYKIRGCIKEKLKV